MRNLIISIVCLSALIIPWLVYNQYASAALEHYSTVLEDEVLPSIELHEWEKAETGFQTVAEDWDNFKTISAYFLDTAAVSEVDGIFLEASVYIRMRDASNAAARITELNHGFSLLHENELPLVENLF